MLLALKFLPLAFSALLPVINPLGSALILLGLVGPASPEVFRNLAPDCLQHGLLFDRH